LGTKAFRILLAVVQTISAEDHAARKLYVGGLQETSEIDEIFRISMKGHSMPFESITVFFKGDPKAV